jgi:hypothetical protein
VNTNKQRSVLLAAIVTASAAMVGCKAIDGRVDSVITGEYSDESAIKAEARKQETAIIDAADSHAFEVEKLQGKLEALYLDVETELAAIGAENIQRNTLINRGLGITSGLIDTFIPQAKPITDSIFPLATDLLLLAGLGGGVGLWQRRRGETAGAATVARGVKRAADADPAFADAINEGKAGRELSREFEVAPKTVIKAINANRVDA